MANAIKKEKESGAVVAKTNGKNAIILVGSFARDLAGNRVNDLVKEENAKIETNGTALTFTGKLNLGKKTKGNVVATISSNIMVINLIMIMRVTIMTVVILNYGRIKFNN